jgi:hypothetical protein
MKGYLHVNSEKMKNVFMSHRKNLRQSYNTKTGTKSFENLTKCKYLETTLTSQNYTHDERRRRLNSKNACNLSVHNILSSRLLHKNVTITIYRSIISSVLYGGETWSHIKNRTRYRKRYLGAQGLSNRGVKRRAYWAASMRQY